MGLTLLRAASQEEGRFDPPTTAPAIILLPEMALSPSEIPDVRTLVRGARTNTLFICGVGQLTHEQANSVEPGADLWDGPSGGRYTNCAIIGLGGTDLLFLQPKIVPSRLEKDSHWPGRLIRYFTGDYLAFAVLICSELLARPADTETLAVTLDLLAKQNVALHSIFWLQHNEKPRSLQFSTSIAHLAKPEAVPTAFLVCSREDRPLRYEHYAVAGAIIPHIGLPTTFEDLDAAYRYVEPLPNQAPLGRLVLLRYDADAYAVVTSRPRSSPTGRPGTEKGAVFEQAIPYVLAGPNLVSSPANLHLEDLTSKSTERATEAMPQIAEAIEVFRRRLIESGTATLLRFLDVALPPRSQVPTDFHGAGQTHGAGDFQCSCWPHRVCIDLLVHDDEVIAAVAEVLCALGALEYAGANPKPVWSKARRTNIEVVLRGRMVKIGVVFPFRCNTAELERALRGRGPGGMTVDALYVVLAPPFRPRVAEIDAARPAPTGALMAGTAAVPTLRAVFYAEFWEGAENGRLLDVLATAGP
jgi:hypothetical protein